ncbi:hypothetical protein BDA99DRAFT_527406, partial [Phascolomyces articulosus]
MPFFQQIRHNAYDILPESRFIKRGLNARQRKAEAYIRKSPKKAKGYLDLANVFIEQNNLRAAIEAYDNGIKCISTSLGIIYNSNNSNNIISNAKQKKKKMSDDNSASATLVQQQELSSKNREKDKSRVTQQQEDDLTILKKERQTILTTLVQYSHQFHRLIPYEILCEIVSYLDTFEDLLECTRVCKRWCKSMVTLPYFWNKMSPTGCLNTECWPAIEITDQYQTRHKVYVMGDYFYHYNIVLTLKDVLTILLSIADDHNIEKLCFYNTKLTDDKNTTALLKTVLKSMKNPPFKQVEFTTGCEIPPDTGIAAILISCSNLTHITMTGSFDNSQYYKYNPGTRSSNDEYLQLKPFLFPRFSALTYLNVCFGLTKITHEKFMIAQLLNDDTLFSRSPNLMHLFISLDIRSFELGSCAVAALKNCSQLKNVVLCNHNYIIPPVNVFLCDFNENEYHDKNDNDSSIKTTQQKLGLSIMDIAKTATKDNIDTNSDDSSTEKVTSSSNNKLSLQQSPPTSTIRKSGLRRFALLHEPLLHHYQNNIRKEDLCYEWSNRSTWENCFSIINKYNQGSIELLYIKNDIIAMQFLDTWCNYGETASNLRELHLDDGGFYGMDLRKKVTGPIDKSKNILAKLFPCLPALEALSIFDSTSYLHYDNQGLNHSHYYKVGPLYVDDHVLEQLSKHCHHIRYIKICGRSPIYTSKGVLSLAENVNPIPNSNNNFSFSRKKLPITYLDMHIPY